jgi:hypothetical protein
MDLVLKRDSAIDSAVAPVVDAWLLWGETRPLILVCFVSEYQLWFGIRHVFSSRILDLSWLLLCRRLQSVKSEDDDTLLTSSPEVKSAFTNAIKMSTLAAVRTARWLFSFRHSGCLFQKTSIF